MDPVTHITAGMLAGQAARPWFPKGRYLLWFAGLAAWIPDADNITALMGPEAFLTWHRSYSHSLLVALLFAPVFTLLFKLFKKNLPFWKGTALAACCLFLHIFLDYITNYGTQVFLPFTKERYTMASVFIIDPFFTLTLLAMLIGTFVSRRLRPMLALFGVLWIFCYPLTNLTIKSAVTDAYTSALKASDTPFERIIVQPDAFTPVFWKVVVEKKDDYEVTGLNLLKPSKKYPVRVFAKPDPDLFDKLERKTSFFKTMRWFLDYPFVNVELNADGHEITLRDIRYMSVNPVTRFFYDETRTPFTVIADFDKQGNLTGYRFRHAGKTLLVHSLN